MPDSPSARLRAAAQLARETAEAAPPGPWKVAPWDPELILSKAWADEEGQPDDRPPFVAVRATDGAAHIALWSPPVALAVAELVESVERAARMAGVSAEHPEALSIRAKALDVADALLRTTPSERLKT